MAFQNNPVQIIKLVPDMFSLYLVVDENSQISPWKKNNSLCPYSCVSEQIGALI